MARACVLALGPFLFLSGCSSSDLVQVNGSLLENGQPYKLALTDDVIQLTFHHQQLDLHLGADMERNGGRFHLKGAIGEGIPPGAYHITIQVIPYAGTRDRLGGKFADRKTTPLTFTATRDRVQEISIDLATKEVKPATKQ